MIMEKKRLLPQFEASMEEVKNLSNKVFEIERKCQILLSERSEKIKNDSAAIEVAEQQIHAKAKELQVEELEVLFQKLCTQFGNYIEKEILSRQLIMIEEEEAKITEKYE